MLTSLGGSINADRGSKICQNLADVICERSLRTYPESYKIIDQKL